MSEDEGKGTYLDSRAVRKRTLKLQHGTGDLISNTGLASLVHNRGGSVCSAAVASPSRATSCWGCGCVVCGGGVGCVAGWVTGGGRLDCAGVGISTTETSHCFDC